MYGNPLKTLDRREFLKLMSVVPAGFLLSQLTRRSEKRSFEGTNVIIVVLDALTARNMSLYGYPRLTTPTIEQFAKRFSVYHSHYSGGTFTTAGTASLLTGTYPWTHRAINLGGLIRRPAQTRNIFNLFNAHDRLVFAQNYFADYLLTQFDDDIETHLPIGAFSELVQFMNESDGKERLTEFRAFNDFIFDGPPASLVLGMLNRYKKAYRAQMIRRTQDDLLQYTADLAFDLQKVFAGLADLLTQLEKPAICYFHLYPPHAPYQPEKGFDQLFLNGWKPKAKPRHNLWKDSTSSRKFLNELRLAYDQFLANTDFAVGEFMSQLQSEGVLDNSLLILTSDHGESFERGYFGHSGPYVYEPGIHIPLLISFPGQTTRRDYYSVTNSVDVLPSLLHWFGYEIPEWCEGTILPGFSGQGENLQTRTTFSMDAKYNSAFGDLPAISIAMRRGDFKLIYYKGYNEAGDPYHNGVFELYDLKNDPEELRDLAGDEPSVLHEMRSELLSAYESGRQIKSSN
jgi:arylsulfatase A-like enzyme